MRFAALSLLLLPFVACVHVKAFYGPDGEREFLIKCNGRFNDMTDCYNRAHELCGGPYRVLGGADDQRVDYGLLGNSPTVVEHRELTVMCR